MFLRLVHRVFSISLAAVLTMGMLGGIDSLSKPDTSTAMAQSAPQVGSACA